MTPSKLMISGSVTLTLSGLLAYPVHAVQAATTAPAMMLNDWSWLPEVLQHILT